MSEVELFLRVIIRCFTIAGIVSGVVILAAILFVLWCEREAKKEVSEDDTRY